ncbi:hypothetical protein BG011_010074 [Mortierella polycephala]|uniref:F-box domain-containing protein n=1 Tax=Mortierella polycephala TaxID=41804 RepID=A0A9P6TVP0_9FUNG|nr:hypothetical protein BG011_010074 [Mortierella polycephala]
MTGVHELVPVKKNNRRRKRKNKRKAQPPTTFTIQRSSSTAQLGNRCRLPIEVVEQIFQYASQSSLRVTLSLVCREWNIISQQFIKRVGTWKSFGQDYQDALMTEIRSGTLNTLDCFMECDPGTPFPYELDDWNFTSKRWNAFMANIQSMSTAAAAQQGNNNPFREFKEVRMLGYNIEDDDRMWALLDHFQFIEKLSIHIYNGPNLWIFQLLDHCPTLRHLDVTGRKGRGLWLYDGENTSPDARYQLQEFTSRSANMEDCLLRIFKALGVDEPIEGGFYFMDSTPMDIRNVYKVAARSCPKLEWFHVSQSIKKDSDEFQLGIDFFPKAEMCTTAMVDLRLTPKAWAHFRQLTVLEISYSTATMETLAMILQETPRLQHLYASRIKVDINELMTYNNAIANAILDQARARMRRAREARTGTGSATPILGGVDEPLQVEGPLWSCQNTLQTLDIGMEEKNSPEKYNFFEGFAALFTKLTTLILRLDEFYVGQQMDHRTKGKSIEQQASDEWKHQAQARVPHYLKLLQPLRSLQSITFRVEGIPGVLDVSDFELLRRTIDLNPILFNAQVLPMGEIQVESPRAPEVVCWPGLDSFKVYYQRSGMVHDYDPLLKQLHELRPGVEFGFLRFFDRPED